MLATAAQANRWHYTVISDSEYAPQIERFVNALGPRPDGIRGALLNGREFHLWVREDRTFNRYRWNCVRTVGSWHEEVANRADNEGVIVLGFNVEQPPCLHVLERRRGRPEVAPEREELQRPLRPDRQLFGEGSKRFTPVQSVPTEDATAWKYFSIAGENYLAVANYYDGRTFNIDSKIYKIDASGLREFQTIRTSGAYDWEHFTIGNDHFLAVANYYDDRSFDINSKIYRWNGQRFVEFQSIPTNGAFDIHYFRIGREHWLAISNEVSRDPQGQLRYAQNSKLYRWDGREFKYFQSIGTAGAHAITSFEIAGQHYLAIAQYYEDSKAGPAAYNPPARILRWHSTQRGFVDFQELPANGAFDVEYFSIDGAHYLAVANSYNGESFDIGSRLFKWSGTRFEPFQTLPTHNATAMHVFRSGSELFLAVANAASGNKATTNFNVNSRVYRWQNGRFEVFQEIATKGAYDIQSFTIGGQTFLVIANSYDGRTTAVDSVIYRLDTSR